MSDISTPSDPKVGGRLKSFYNEWKEITNDPYILSAILGYKIEFDPSKFPPTRKKPFYEYKRSTAEASAIEAEIQSLESKNVIERCEHTKGEFISNIFTRPKKNGKLRLILDLSDLNESVAYQHFKMDNIESTVLLLTPDCFMASIDLQDAYYSVPIHPSSRKYLRFFWNGELWQYKALPNGLSSAPRLFTKLLKPVFATLHEQGHTVLGYLDDTIIVGKSYAKAKEAVNATTTLLTSLGFLVHPDKSVLEPAKELRFLGFMLDTKEMVVSLPTDKKEELQNTISELLDMTKPSIRHVARTIGKIVASFPATQYGSLFYRELEKGKIQALKENRGHFDRPMNLSIKAREELQWWLSHIDSNFKPICRKNPDLEIRSDASGQGWGATDLVTHTGGRWNDLELAAAANNEINYLETTAAGLALQSFCSDKSDIHVLIRLDNTTAVSYINNMGGIKSPPCNSAAINIWNWCIDRNIWLTASHLPGRENTEADRCSRQFNDRTEWMLNKSVFEDISQHFGTPKLDLFASRLNAQTPRYVSWKPDPHAVAVDAFTLDWHELDFYAFPPFSLVARCLQKIQSDHAKGLIVVPDWPTQSWFPTLKGMLLGEPLNLHYKADLLTQPVTGSPHPLHNLNLLCCRVGSTLTNMVA